MRAWWGNYAFPVNAAEVTNRTTAELSAQGLPLRYVSVYDVTAWIEGSGQADLSNKEVALRNALAIPRQDFILRTDSGAVSSASIISKNTLSGTRIRDIAFTESQGAEFVNRRTVHFTVDAVYLIASSANAVISWHETVTIRGTGGPRRVWRYPVNAKAIRQIMSPNSPVFATQSGQAVGHTKKPRCPLPIWPGYVVEDDVTKRDESPDFLGLAYVNYAVSWSYRFERGDGPLVGFAGLPPGVV